MNNISNYIQRILDAEEYDAWGIAYEMIESEDIRSLLLRQYLSSEDAGYSFLDSVHELIIDLMEDDRRKLRGIHNIKLSSKWLQKCYGHTLKRCDTQYNNSKKAFVNSILSLLDEERHEVDDKTWILCIMLVKMEDSLDALWLFIFYRMQLRQHKTNGLEIHAKEIAQAIGITHQRYRDRITNIRNKSQRMLKNTKMSDLNSFSLEQQQRVADYVTAICEQGSLEEIFLTKYHNLIEGLPCKDAINEVIDKESAWRLMGNQYAFKRLPREGYCFEPLPGSAEEELLMDNEKYERSVNEENPVSENEISLLYYLLSAFIKQKFFLRQRDDKI